MEPSPSPHLRGSPALMLAVGVVLLEFATAVSTFVTGTLLPLIERDLSAHGLLPLLVAGTTIGMFTALPLSTRIIGRYAPRAVLAAGLALSLLGSAVAAAAATPVVFAAGRFVAGFAGALLAVYGVSAAIQHLETPLRLKVMAAMSAMWILPALVGPSATIGLEHVVGWRWTLLAPLPLMVAGRMLVVRSVPAHEHPAEEHRPLGRGLLIPLGVAAFIGLNASPARALSPVVLLVSCYGFLSLMPVGTARLRRGAPAALAGLTLFGAGYFGADSLLTLFMTHAFGTTLVHAGIVLSAAPLAWGLASLLAPKLGARGLPPVWGMTLTTVGVAAMAALGLTGAAWTGALVAWALTGLGVGLAYPGLYLRATTEEASLSANQLAAAVITTESFGGLIGSAAGAALTSASGVLGITRGDALAWSYVGFAAVLLLTAVAAARSSIGRHHPRVRRFSSRWIPTHNDNRATVEGTYS